LLLLLLLLRGLLWGLLSAALACDVRLKLQHTPTAATAVTNKVNIYVNDLRQYTGQRCRCSTEAPRSTQPLGSGCCAAHFAVRCPAVKGVAAQHPGGAKPVQLQLQ
jgi:hypothetical protein